MKKFLFLSIVLFASSYSFAQLISGTLVDSQRIMETKYDFKIQGKHKGVKFFKIAVNNLGEVTGVTEDIQATSFVSTPAKLLALKQLGELKFEGGTSFPKFQHALVKVEFVLAK